jgi:hypothetical protein
MMTMTLRDVIIDIYWAAAHIERFPRPTRFKTRFFFCVGGKKTSWFLSEKGELTW